MFVVNTAKDKAEGGVGEGVNGEVNGKLMERWKRRI